LATNVQFSASTTPSVCRMARRELLYIP
jgi:hypothetical protein